MNFNTLLLRLGFKPDDFLDVPVDPLPFDGGYIFEAELKTTMRQCRTASQQRRIFTDILMLNTTAQRIITSRTFFASKSLAIYV
jgi:hypothetical protein